MSGSGNDNTDHIGKKRGIRDFNIGILIFGAIILYLIVTVILYFTSGHISSYEVKRGSLSYNTQCSGVALRSEEVFPSEGTGYITYYQTEGRKVRVGSKLYSVDSTGDTTRSLTENTESGKLSSESISKLESSISDFQDGFKDKNFYLSYDFKHYLESQTMNLQNEAMISELDASGTDYAGFQVITAPQDGVISYMTDGLEGLTRESFAGSILSKDGYSRTDLRDDQEITAGDPAYKLVSSDDWSIIVRPDDAAYRYLTEKGYSEIQVRFEKDRMTLWADVTLFDQGTDHFIELHFDNSMVRYISDRFLDVTLIIEEETGLKIPKSALVEKECYTVPSDYVVTGGSSNTTGVYVMSRTKSGEIIPVFTEINVYYEDEENRICYLDQDDLLNGSQLMLEDSADVYIVRETASLTGVYNINKGYAAFKRVDIAYENSEYCIVKEGSSYGISNYDMIALSGDSVRKEDIL